MANHCRRERFLRAPARGTVLASRPNEMEANQWQDAFAEQQFLVLESVLTDPLLSVAHEYSIKRAIFQRETTSEGAGPGTPSFYADPLMETLLDLFHSVAQTFSGLELSTTFSDLRVYGRGAIVNPHTERPAGEITLSVSLGFEGPDIWPFFIGTRQGVRSAPLAPGDAILYRACDCPHWRGEFSGEHHIQAFFHYVDRNGPHAEWQYDKRPMQSVGA